MKQDTPRSRKAAQDLLAQVVREELDEPKLRKIVRKLIAQAQRGDQDARKTLFERGWGKPKETIEVRTDVDFAGKSTDELWSILETAMLERGKVLPVIDATCNVLPAPETPLAGLVQELTHNETGRQDSDLERWLHDHERKADAGTGGSGVVGEAGCGQAGGPEAEVPAREAGEAMGDDAEGLHLASQPADAASPDHAPDRTGESDGAASGGGADEGAVPVSSVHGIAPEAGPEDEDPSTLLDECEEEITPEQESQV